MLSVIVTVGINVVSSLIVSYAIMAKTKTPKRDPTSAVGAFRFGFTQWINNISLSL